MQWVQDRRYVVDNGILTSTGITASLPVMVTLVEAIAGRPQADRLAQELGVVPWDARHRSSGFQLTLEHQKTFVRNWLAFWRRETLGVPVREGVDEIALGLTVDAYARTALSTVVTVGRSSTAVRSRYGLMIHPTTSGQPAAVVQSCRHRVRRPRRSRSTGNWHIAARLIAPRPRSWPW